MAYRLVAAVCNCVEPVGIEPTTSCVQDRRTTISTSDPYKNPPTHCVSRGISFETKSGSLDQRLVGVIKHREQFVSHVHSLPYFQVFVLAFEKRYNLNMTDPIFWAVVRDQTERHSYIELAHITKDKWSAVLGDTEFTFKVPGNSKEFFDVLRAALNKLDSLTALSQDSTV